MTEESSQHFIAHRQHLTSAPNCVYLITSDNQLIAETQCTLPHENFNSNFRLWRRTTFMKLRDNNTVIRRLKNEYYYNTNTKIRCIVFSDFWFTTWRLQRHCPKLKYVVCAYPEINSKLSMADYLTGCIVVPYTHKNCVMALRRTYWGRLWHEREFSDYISTYFMSVNRYTGANNLNIPIEIQHMILEMVNFKDLELSYERDCFDADGRPLIKAPYTECKILFQTPLFSHPVVLLTPLCILSLYLFILLCAIIYMKYLFDQPSKRKRWFTISFVCITYVCIRMYHNEFDLFYLYAKIGEFIFNFYKNAYKFLFECVVWFAIELLHVLPTIN